MFIVQQLQRPFTSLDLTSSSSSCNLTRVVGFILIIKTVREELCVVTEVDLPKSRTTNLQFSLGRDATLRGGGSHSSVSGVLITDLGNMVVIRYRRVE
jgi:hypothetical protein